MTRDRGALPDLVYPYKHSTDGEELRFSLRSLCKNANGLFGRVWIVGDLPEWAVGVEHVPTVPGASRQADVRAKWWSAADHPDVSPTFLLMNDDFWLCRKIRRFAAFHMGPTSEYLDSLARRGDTHFEWQRTIRATADWMAEQGHGDVLVRQGHRPSLWRKDRLAEALADYPADRPLDVLGLYDLAGAGGVGVRVGNSKITNSAVFHAKTAAAALDECPWLSATDGQFSDGLVGGYVRALFPDPCRFEQEV